MSRSPRDQRIEQVRERYRAGECCAQAIVGTYLADATEQRNTLLHNLAAGLCGGMGNRQADCGALVGAALCLGPLLAEDGALADDARVRTLAAALNQSFDQRFGASSCAEVLRGKSLLGRQRAFCEGVTLETAMMLESIIAEQSAASNRRG